MNFEVVFTQEASASAKKHLLQHYCCNKKQEDLCFALWCPSTGKTRRTGIIDQILLPEEGDEERILHWDQGVVSFTPAYFRRVFKIARQEKKGIAFMHSHPTPGWQGMSHPDVKAEQTLAFPARVTGLPLIGLTLGRDGYWSARFWEKSKKMRRYWCKKVRVINPNSYDIYFNDHIAPPHQCKEILKRTFDTWGKDAQNKIARLTVGIVGLGSVGCIVAEAIARIGVSRVVLIDPDKVEKHNLDRLLYATSRDVGKLKVELAKQKIKKHATAKPIKVMAYPVSIQDRSAYDAALDCDIIFSCVDRPVGRDILNYMAYAHLIPVIEGGVEVQVQNERLSAAHWRTHIVTPYHRCLCCSRQYSSGDVTVELDGSLDNPDYISNLPAEQRHGNRNVFPFCLSIAGMQVNLMLRYLLSPGHWVIKQQQDYNFINGKIYSSNEQDCRPDCEFRKRKAKGDSVTPPYLKNTWSIPENPAHKFRNI